MRIFARQDQQRFTPFKLTQSIEGAFSLLGEQLRIHAIEVRKELPEDSPPILGEPLQIEQVLLNLFSNARDALDSRAEAERKEAGTGHFHKALLVRLTRAGAHELCLEVRDNGIGMNEETRAKIFEPFYTTKPVGRGTGLGLSISYGIVTSHNGRFEVDCKPGQGTSFRIYFPIYDASGEGALAAHDEETKL
jgi:signal transduction histidine kinase